MVMAWLPAYMALMLCPYCHQYLDPRSRICPKCGLEVPKLCGNAESAWAALFLVSIFLILIPILVLS